jgi:mercuric ion transport protein
MINPYPYFAGMKAGDGSDDPEACRTASKFSRIMLWISAVIYATGFFAAFILGPLLAKFD